MNEFKISGNIADIPGRCFYFGTLTVSNGKIVSIAKEGDEKKSEPCILPGFIDSHVHIESSMLIPSEFARLAVLHGTTATISDPHEIANVCGKAGVQFMIDNGKQVPLKFHFGAPSCVPATAFETAGAELNADAVDDLLQSPDIFYLSEMMNYPAVLRDDAEVLRKISSAKKYGKPTDGHAPGLNGAAIKKYIETGISTDHECFTAAEALEKLSLGMKVLIREGSAAKNFDALIPLLEDHWENMMFCSDDKHPDSLLQGHINLLCKRAVEKNIDVFKILQVACINPVLHYKMHCGMLRKDDPADFIVADDCISFRVRQTYINGELVADNGTSLIKRVAAPSLNNFECREKKPGDFKIRAAAFQKDIQVIEALDGQLITNKLRVAAMVSEGNIVSDPENDILKIVVVNRYREAEPAIGFIKDFGLKQGALASSVAHDSHNIVAVGLDDEDICEAVNQIIRQQGGISAVSEEKVMLLPLPVGGLMSAEDAFKVSADYTAINEFAIKELGSTLSAPFMTLSFMALTVIPHVKMSDLGLFDGDSFSFINI